MCTTLVFNLQVIELLLCPNPSRHPYPKKLTRPSQVKGATQSKDGRQEATWAGIVGPPWAVPRGHVGPPVAHLLTPLQVYLLPV